MSISSTVSSSTSVAAISARIETSEPETQTTEVADRLAAGCESARGRPAREVKRHPPGRLGFTPYLPNAPPQRLAYRVNEAAQISGLCRTKQLPFVTVGGIRLIHHSALVRLLQLEEAAS